MPPERARTRDVAADVREPRDTVARDVDDVVERGDEAIARDETFVRVDVPTLPDGTVREAAVERFVIVRLFALCCDCFVVFSSAYSSSFASITSSENSIVSS